MDNRIQEIFSKIQQDLEGTDSVSVDMQAWSVNYFRNHKSRYLSDLRLVRQYYKSGNILEIGSAPFHFTALLSDLGMPVTGVDINPERFSSFIKEKNLNVVRCDVEMEDLPFDEDAFHLVLFNEVFEHLRIDPIMTLKKIRRILNPEGVLMLSTPNLYSITTVVNFLRGKGFDDPYEQFDKIQKFGHMGHVREYSVAQVRKFLEQTGFEVIGVQLHSHAPLKGLWTPMNLLRKAFPGFQAYQTHICKVV